MNIHVFVKRVPDTESRIRIDAAAGTVIEEGLNFIISPNDEFAVEEALRLREAKGGVVRVFSVGRDESLVILRKCLAMGADEAVLIKDESPESLRRPPHGPDRRRRGPDEIPRIRPAPLRQTIGRSGQRPGPVDGRRTPRDCPRRTSSPSSRSPGTAGRPIGRSRAAIEKVAFSLPAVVSAQKGLNEPRYETLKGIMAAKKKAIPVIPVEDLGLSAGDLGSGRRNHRDRHARRQSGRPGRS